MQGERVELSVPGSHRRLGMVRHGHYGRPVLVFPTQGGRAEDFADHGMVSAVQWLVDDGRVTLFCLDATDATDAPDAPALLDAVEPRDALDAESRADRGLSAEDVAESHATYQGWVEDAVVPAMFEVLGGHQDIIALGASTGANDAMHFAFRRADLAPLAIGLSGTYDVGSWRTCGAPGNGTDPTSPADLVASLDEGRLDWLRQRLSVLLVCGQGDKEAHPAGALPSTRRFAELLSGKGIAHQLDLWDNDAGHDWPWWGQQLAHHLPRFC